MAAKPDAIDVGFCRAVLGYATLDDDNAVDPLGHGSTVWLQELDADKPLRHAMHVDVSVARAHVESRLASALDAGGRIVHDADAPGAWILADRAGTASAWSLGQTDPSHLHLYFRGSVPRGSPRRATPIRPRSIDTWWCRMRASPRLVL